MVTSAPPLTYEQTSKVLEKLADLDHEIILVGGQALNFWANYYYAKSSDLRGHGPFTSQDIDFFGSHKAVSECAKRLGGSATLATLDDMNTPNTGVVSFVDEDRYERVIDFLGEVAGLKDKEVGGLPATVLDANGQPSVTFLVLDPVSCLRSRAYNVARLPGYQTPHALMQLRAAVYCVKEYGRDLLSQGKVKATNAINGAVFSLARYGVGVEVFVDHGIDVLNALIVDPGLPDKFYSHRLPYARAAVTRARDKAQKGKTRGEALRK